MARFALRAIAAALVLAMCGGATAAAARAGASHAQAAKKKRKHCRAGYTRKKMRRHGKVRYRCVKKKKATPKAPATTPQTQSGPSALDVRLTSHAGFWFEHDLDHDGVCYLYSFQVGSGGEHRGVRTSFYVNPFTGACRVTSEPYAQNSYFVWRTSGNVVTDQFVSGYSEQLPTGAYNSADGTMSVGRDGVGVVWADCTSPYWPYVKPAGC